MRISVVPARDRDRGSYPGYAEALKLYVYTTKFRKREQDDRNEPNRQLRLWPTHSHDIGCPGWRLRLPLPGLPTQVR